MAQQYTTQGGISTHHYSIANTTQRATCRGIIHGARRRGRVRTKHAMTGRDRTTGRAFSFSSPLKPFQPSTRVSRPCSHALCRSISSICAFFSARSFSISRSCRGVDTGPDEMRQRGGRRHPATKPRALASYTRSARQERQGKQHRDWSGNACRRHTHVVLLHPLLKVCLLVVHAGKRHLGLPPNLVLQHGDAELQGRALRLRRQQSARH